MQKHEEYLKRLAHKENSLEKEFESTLSMAVDKKQKEKKELQTQMQSKIKELNKELKFQITAINQSKSEKDQLNTELRSLRKIIKSNDSAQIKSSGKIDELNKKRYDIENKIRSLETSINKLTKAKSGLSDEEKKEKELLEETKGKIKKNKDASKYLIIALIIVLATVITISIKDGSHISNIQAELLDLNRYRLKQIDDPANVREKPEGDILFVLNNNSEVYVMPIKNNWSQILVPVKLDAKNFNKEMGGVKKGIILYDQKGDIIGKTKSFIECNYDFRLDKNSTKHQYVGFLSAYTHQVNIISNDYIVYGTSQDKIDPYLNVREGPSTSYPILIKLSDGAHVTLLEKNHGENGRWCKIYCDIPIGGKEIDDYVGYVYNKYIKKY